MTNHTVDTDIPESALQDVGLHERITAIDHSQGTHYRPIDKLQAHLQNIQHVAISIFVFDEDRLLLQKRAATKYHSAGLWANTVCSHPRWQESTEDCAKRRLQEELGWQVPLTTAGSIQYQAKVGDLYENEQVHCFTGLHNQSNELNDFNRTEVEAVQWLTIAQINQQIATHPATFTEWFKIYMKTHSSMIEGMLRKH